MDHMSLAAEMPLPEVPAEMHWSENYCFDGYDPKTGVGFWLHLGRWHRNADLWREEVFLYLPDGTFCVHRAIGRRKESGGAFGPTLSLLCEKAGETWRMRFQGPARRTTPEELAGGELKDAPLDYLELDVVFDATSAVWDFGESVKDEVWASSHYEQTGSLRGTVTFAGETIAMDTHGFRDHSRGPRVQKSIAGHCWIHGQFPDGTGFALFDLRMRQGKELVQGVAMAAVFADNRTFKATYSSLPYLTSIHNPPSSYAIRIESERGTMNLEARVLRSLPLTVDSLNDSYYGVSVIAGVSTLVAWEQPTEFTWNGRIGIGHTERTCNIGETR